MNDRVFTIAMFLTFLLIGANGMLLVGGQLLSTDGSSVLGLYGLNSSNLGTGYASHVNTYQTSQDFTMSSQSPSAEEGYSPVKIDAQPAGLDWFWILAVMVAGVQIYMYWFAGIFPLLAPLFYAVIVFATAVQGLVVIELGSAFIRNLFGLRA